jgi:hypothetical protein
MTGRGRPSKPVEVKRMLGNPGRRPLPNLGEVQLLPSAVGIPEPERPLLQYGRALWDKVWGAGINWISPTTDVELLLMTCEMVDERWNLRVKVLRDDNARDRRGLRDLDRIIIGNLSLLGFTPTDRSRLGVAEVKAQSKVEDMLAKRAEREQG